MSAPHLDFEAVRQRELLDGFSTEDQIVVSLLAGNETRPLPTATPPDSAKIVERLLECWANSTVAARAHLSGLA